MGAAGTMGRIGAPATSLGGVCRPTAASLALPGTDGLDGMDSVMWQPVINDRAGEGVFIIGEAIAYVRVPKTAADAVKKRKKKEGMKEENETKLIRAKLLD